MVEAWQWWLVPGYRNINGTSHICRYNILLWLFRATLWSSFRMFQEIAKENKLFLGSNLVVVYFKDTEPQKVTRQINAPHYIINTWCQGLIASYFKNLLHLSSPTFTVISPSTYSFHIQNALGATRHLSEHNKRELGLTSILGLIISDYWLMDGQTFQYQNPSLFC